MRLWLRPTPRYHVSMTSNHPTRRADRILGALVKHSARLAVLGTGLAATAATAMQDSTFTQQRPPVPSTTPEPPIILTFGIIVVLVAIGLGAQAMPSKRGHQD